MKEGERPESWGKGKGDEMVLGPQAYLWAFILLLVTAVGSWSLPLAEAGSRALPEYQIPRGNKPDRSSKEVGRE